jgi:hypothetical protein
MILERPSGPSILSHPRFVTVAAAAACPSDGPPSTCASSAPARSPAADPPGSRPGTLREHAMNRRAAISADMGAPDRCCLRRTSERRSGCSAWCQCPAFTCADWDCRAPGGARSRIGCRYRPVFWLANAALRPACSRPGGDGGIGRVCSGHQPDTKPRPAGIHCSAGPRTARQDPGLRVSARSRSDRVPRQLSRSVGGASSRRRGPLR